MKQNNLYFYDARHVKRIEPLKGIMYAKNCIEVLKWVKSQLKIDPKENVNNLKINVTILQKNT